MDEKPALGDVTLERTANGVRFVFPPRSKTLRQRDRIAVALVIPFLIALALTSWGCLVWGPADWYELSLFGGIVLTLFTVPVAWLGIVFTYGHSEIAVEGGEIVASERAGVFTRVRRRPLRRLQRLEITTRTFWLDAQNVGQQSWVRNQREVQWALRGYFLAWDPLVLAVGYRHAVLEAVARALSDLANTALAQGSPAAEPSPSPCSATAAAQSGPTLAPPLACPSAVEVVFEQEREPPRPDARYLRVSGEGTNLRFEFPPSGWLGEGGCLILFGGVLAALLTFSIISFCVRGAPLTDESWGALLCPSLMLFGAIGLIILGDLAVRAPGDVIEVSDWGVRVTQAGLTRSRRWRWRRDELTAIRHGSDGDGHAWLQIDLAGGTYEQFSGAGHVLAWVAWRLRQVLGLPEIPP